MGAIRLPNIRKKFRAHAKSLLERYIIPLFLGAPESWAHENRYEITDGTGSKVSAFVIIVFEDPDDGEIKVFSQEKNDKLAGAGGGHYVRKLKEQTINCAAREHCEEVCDDEGRPIVPDILKYIEERPLISAMGYFHSSIPPIICTGYIAWLTDPVAINALKLHTRRMKEDEVYRNKSLTHANHELTGVRISKLSEAIEMAYQEGDKYYLHTPEKMAFQRIERYFGPNYAARLRPAKEATVLALV